MKNTIHAILIIFILATYATPPLSADQELTNEEIEISKVLSAEACGEGEHGMWAIANVVANRARRRGLTPYQVVTQPSQFYGYTSPNKEKLYLQCKHISDRFARNVMSMEDITKGATHYENIEQFGTPGWARGFRQTTKIGRHTFYATNG